MSEPTMIDGRQSWSFGDSPGLADELLALVLMGKKTATCGALRDYIADGTPIPALVPLPGRAMAPKPSAVRARPAPGSA